MEFTFLIGRSQSLHQSSGHKLSQLTEPIYVGYSENGIKSRPICATKVVIIAGIEIILNN